ncbi:MAG: hypothetical protein J6T57_00825 [Alphaproteobacteria bacterium]|nr:hypothetical protein [Alphaproteobacteria bacterium]
MAFDKKIVDAVKAKYDVDVNANAEWFKCEKIWKDPEFQIYFANHYDERIVQAVRAKYGVNMHASHSGYWWDHDELFKDADYGTYFAKLRWIGWKNFNRFCSSIHIPYRPEHLLEKHYLIPDLPDLDGKSR